LQIMKNALAAFIDRFLGVLRMTLAWKVLSMGTI
jgi:hypothetical protein